jgi:alkyl sulfatase BDS1-like metallo-beta-lactamase superfamily hydrolase
MESIKDLAEALWSGGITTTEAHPFDPPHGTVEIARDTWFIKGFSNSVVRRTEDGLIIVDPSAFMDVDVKYKTVRQISSRRLNTAIFTHGHVDHVFGVSPYRDESEKNGWKTPVIIAHENMAPRFKRYCRTVTWNKIINERQFLGGIEGVDFPHQFDSPDQTYQDSLDVIIGGISVRLHHCRGETDDHTWVFFPDTGVLCTGDLFIWAVPNAGNPQKVQRYAREWAAGLRKMMALEPEVLAPGHGVYISGKERVAQALDDTASLLESLHEQTVGLMNKGASLDEIIHTVKAPEELVNKPYLKPVYDEPEFIIRNIWRFYGGWYDGTPSHLKPAPEKEQAEEIAQLAGGADRLVQRAEELAARGNFRMACHLADWALQVDPGGRRIREAVRDIYTKRAEIETSTMARGLYQTAANIPVDNAS